MEKLERLLVEIQNLCNQQENENRMKKVFLVETEGVFAEQKLLDRYRDHRLQN